MIVTDMGDTDGQLTIQVSDLDPIPPRQDTQLFAWGTEIHVTYIPYTAQNSEMKVDGVPYSGPRLVVTPFSAVKIPVTVVGWHIVKVSARIEDDLEPGGFFLETVDFCYVPDSETFTAFDTVVTGGEFAERIKYLRRQRAERAARTGIE